MIIYQGNDVYQIGLEDKVIELSLKDIQTIIGEFTERVGTKDLLDSLKDYIDVVNEPEEEDKYEYQKREVQENKKSIVMTPKISRSYNKKEKILKLYNRYSNSSNTNKSVFTRIAKELNISVKAVDKAYYSK